MMTIKASKGTSLVIEHGDTKLVISFWINNCQQKISILQGVHLGEL
jgi:hypothetical protein